MERGKTRRTSDRLVWGCKKAIESDQGALETPMIGAHAMHSWLSCNVFLPWVVHGPWTKRRRQFRAALAEARVRFQAWERSDPELRERWVLAELRAIVRWAGKHVPYYRGLFRAVGFDPHADFSLADYRGLPILEREIVRRQATELIATTFPPDIMVAKPTGGSTGEPLRIWVDEYSRAWSQAVTEWAFARVGCCTGARVGLIWGASVEPQMHETKMARIVNWLAHQQANDCFRMSEEILDRIDARLSAYQPDFLRCYPGALALLSYRLGERRRCANYPNHGIITGGEKLAATQRAIIREAFAVPIYESYGSRDCGLMAMQLSALDPRLHVINGNVLLEPFGDPDPVAGNEVIVTHLHRRGMPFLRYRIGDRASFPFEAWERPAEFLNEVTGRALDILYLPGGKFIHSIQFVTLFKNFDLREYQVIQDADGSVRVRLVTGTHFTSDDLAQIQRLLRGNLLGVSLSVALVPSIERTSAGKLRPVISHYRPAHPFSPLLDTSQNKSNQLPRS
jgi:phenylacetate-CoA ligase